MRDTAVWQRPAALLLRVLYLGCDPQAATVERWTSGGVIMKPARRGAPADGRRIILEEIRHKWKNLSEEDLSSLRNSDDLVIQLQARYGLSKRYAGYEVDIF
jgi:hypothetical protein